MEVIKFSKKIYSLEAVNQAINEFKNLADFALRESDLFFYVKIDNIDKQYADILKDEFSNFVLGLMS